MHDAVLRRPLHFLGRDQGGWHRVVVEQLALLLTRPATTTTTEATITEATTTAAAAAAAAAAIIHGVSKQRLMAATKTKTQRPAADRSIAREKEEQLLQPMARPTG